LLVHSRDADRLDFRPAYSGRTLRAWLFWRPYHRPPQEPRMTGDPEPSLAWLGYALVTVVTWGSYGVLLHTGQMNMADPVNGRFKAFLFVGVAYFITAIIAPLLVMWANGASMQTNLSGAAWSLAAGIIGAIGAFCVVMAFAARGSPPAVMSVVFGLAP